MAALAGAGRGRGRAGRPCGGRLLPRGPVGVRDGPARVRRGAADRDAWAAPDRAVAAAVGVPRRRIARRRVPRRAVGDAPARRRAGARAARRGLLCRDGRGQGTPRAAASYAEDDRPLDPVRPLARPAGHLRGPALRRWIARASGENLAELPPFRPAEDPAARMARRVAHRARRHRDGRGAGVRQGAQGRSPARTRPRSSTSRRSRRRRSSGCSSTTSERPGAIDLGPSLRERVPARASPKSQVYSVSK